MPVDVHVPAIEITTVKNCSVNCAPWCPQLAFRAQYGDKDDILSFDDFKLALSKIPKSVVISFAGFSEPFLNSRALDMMELAKSEGYHLFLASTVVGLRAEDVSRLKDLFDYFILHLPDNKGIAHINYTPNYGETLTRVFQTMKIDAYSRMDEEFLGEDRAGNADAGKHYKVRGPFFCYKLANPQPVMLPNLDLQLCCEDWRLKHTLGSLRTKTYDEIITSSPYIDIVKASHGLGGSELCRSCPRAWGPVRYTKMVVGGSLYEWLGKQRVKEV